MCGERYLTEIEPEIRDWLSTLPARSYTKAEEAVAQKICLSEHLPAHEEFSRAVTKGDIR